MRGSDGVQSPSEPMTGGVSGKALSAAGHLSNNLNALPRFNVGGANIEHGIWTYGLDEVRDGVRAAFSSLMEDAEGKFGARPESFCAMGVSAMMHGYLPFDEGGKLLAPFRTWRNTMTEKASEELTALLGFNIPQRWSAAHLYQAILNKEEHVGSIAFMTTLAGYVHRELTGEKFLGVGDASGMFPIDSEAADFDSAMLDSFEAHIAGFGYPWRFRDILPEVKKAGEPAGKLTEAGALYLDPGGKLKPGIPLCPPEGDAGTGMTATNSVAPRTGNISAGTSIFAMAVLEKPLSRVYPEIDMVTTPAGDPVAMVHCINGTADIDAWAGLLGEAAGLSGAPLASSELYAKLFAKSLEGAEDCGGLLAFNYLAGEHITGFEEGRPLLIRRAGGDFSIANLMQAIMFSTLATLKIGMDILSEQEMVKLDRLTGHGGFFKTERVGQVLMASALGAPVAVMESAGEGGAWGIALLAAYMAGRGPEESLGAWLYEKVFGGTAGAAATPDENIARKFGTFMKAFQAGLPVEEAAVTYA